MLPPPTVDLEVMKGLIEWKDQVNPLFWRALETFKTLIRRNLAPKNSYNHGEYVTGEGNIIKSVASKFCFSQNVFILWRYFQKCSETTKMARKENSTKVLNEMSKDARKKGQF